jgi:hypothetical protein
LRGDPAGARAQIPRGLLPAAGENVRVLHRFDQSKQREFPGAAFIRAVLFCVRKRLQLHQRITGKPDPLPFGDKIVGVCTYRDGSVLDLIRNITS